jgi:hypothetical protein
MPGTPAATVRDTKILLFEASGLLTAVSVVQRAHDPSTADLVVLAVAEDLRGARLDERPARPLCAAVLEETARVAAQDGYKRILAVVAEQNKVSKDEAEDWRDMHGTVIHAALSEGRPLTT